MNKRVKLVGLTAAAMIVLTGCGVSDEQQAMIDNYPTLEAKIVELEAKVKEAEPWFSLKENEKLEVERKEAELEKERQLKEQEEAIRKQEGVLVYEDDNVKINFKEVKKNGILFMVENKTDVVLTVQADSVAVNGLSSNNIMMSDDISPNSKGMVHAQTSIDSSIDLNNILTISGQLRIIDFNDSMDSYDVSFVNVNVSK